MRVGKKDKSRRQKQASNWRKNSTRVCVRVDREQIQRGKQGGKKEKLGVRWAIEQGERAKHRSQLTLPSCQRNDEILRRSLGPYLVRPWASPPPTTLDETNSLLPAPPPRSPPSPLPPVRLYICYRCSRQLPPSAFSTLPANVHAAQPPCISDVTALSQGTTADRNRAIQLAHYTTVLMRIDDARVAYACTCTCTCTCISLGEVV